jgi:2'-5' RNA ligase
MAQPGELFLMARVPEAIRVALLRVLADADMDTTLGRALYPPRNWHQSLSDLHPAAAREAMRQACAGLDAHAFELRLDRLESSGITSGRIHFQFVPSTGKPEGLADLLTRVRGRLHTQGIVETQGHRAHVTVSYNARQGIEPLRIEPVSWLIDTVELVEAAGRGNDYRYDVVEAWPLHPPLPPPPTQLGLLG